MINDKRQQCLLTWLEKLYKTEQLDLSPLKGDASFRRYFRLSHQQQSYVVMDAPTALESTDDFVKIARSLKRQGVNTPTIYHHNLAHGFIVMSDFGDTDYLSQLDDTSADSLYQQAIDTLLRLQTIQQIEEWPLNPFDGNFIRQEIELFNQWFLTGLLKIDSQEHTEMLSSVYQRLIDNNHNQPQVLIHRDYHSRNLMVTDQHSPGVLDFQDAMIGPISYDLASLLKDCYIDWPDISPWLHYYLKGAKHCGILATNYSEPLFAEQFELTGIQRHLKAIGIFSRLYLRDDKASYLKDIPRTLDYIIDASGKIEALSDFNHWLSHSIYPRIL